MLLRHQLTQINLPRRNNSDSSSHQELVLVNKFHLRPNLVQVREDFSGLPAGHQARVQRRPPESLAVKVAADSFSRTPPRFVSTACDEPGPSGSGLASRPSCGCSTPTRARFGFSRCFSRVPRAGRRSRKIPGPGGIDPVCIENSAEDLPVAARKLLRSKRGSPSRSASSASSTWADPANPWGPGFALEVG